MSLQLGAPAFDLRRNILRSRRTGRTSLRKRTANIENCDYIRIEKRREVFELNGVHSWLIPWADH